MVTQKLEDLGYKYTKLSEDLEFKGAKFKRAVKVGNLVFTSGAVSLLDNDENKEEMRGKVGAEIDLETAQKGAEWAAYNCICSAGSVVDINKIAQVVKMTGMVNVADGFDQTSEVINGANMFLEKVFGENGKPARTAVGMVLPSNWSVEIDMVFEVS